MHGAKGVESRARPQFRAFVAYSRHRNEIARASGRKHAARRTARRRGKTPLREGGHSAGQVRDLAWTRPSEAFSDGRARRAARKVRCRSMFSALRANRK